MKLDHILLGVLMQHPRTGYDLKRFLDSSGRFLRSHTQMSQVYRTLSQMEDRGWVTHTVQPRPGAQDAKEYAATEEGVTIFMDWLTGPYQPPSRFQDPEFTARLTFSGFLTPEQVVGLVDVEIVTRVAQVARYRHRDRSSSWEPPAGYDVDTANLVAEWAHESGAEAMDAHIARLYSLRADLLELPASSPAPRQELVGVPLRA